MRRRRGHPASSLGYPEAHLKTVTLQDLRTPYPLYPREPMDNANPATKYREMSVAEVLERLHLGEPDSRDLAVWKITQLADKLDAAVMQIDRMQKMIPEPEPNPVPPPHQPFGPGWVTVWTPQGYTAVPEHEAYRYNAWSPERLTELMDAVAVNAGDLAAQRQIVEAQGQLLEVQGRQIALLRELSTALRVVLSNHVSHTPLTYLAEAQQAAHDLAAFDG